MIQPTNFALSTALTSFLAAAFAAVIFTIPTTLWSVATLVSNSL